MNGSVEFNGGIYLCDRFSGMANFLSVAYPHIYTQYLTGNNAMADPKLKLSFWSEYHSLIPVVNDSKIPLNFDQD